MIIAKKQIGTVFGIVLFILILQIFARYFLIQPFYQQVGVEFQMSGFRFLLIVLASIFIAVAAYFQVLYFDDKVKRFSCGKGNTKNAGYEKIINFSFALDIIGCLAGIYAAWSIGFLNLGFLFIMAATLLYFYALRYRRLFFWGTLCIALLPVIIMGFVVLFEYFATRQNPLAFGTLVINSSFLSITLLVGVYAVVLSLLVYLVQIMEQTMYSQLEPFTSSGIGFVNKFGLKKTKILLSIFLFVLLAFLLFVAIKANPFFDKYVVWGNTIFLSCSIIFLQIKLFTLKQKEDYLLVLSILKVLIIVVILSMVELKFLGFKS